MEAAMLRTILAVVVIVFAGVSAARAQTYDQLSAWCYGDSTDDQTIQGCDAVIASGRAQGNDLAAAYGARAYAYNRKGDYARAMVDHDVAIRMNPNDAMLRNNRGWTYNNMRQYQRALQDLDEAIRMNPRLAEAYNNRGVAYNGLRQFDRAIQEYDEAIRLRPGYPVATRNRDLAIRNRDQAGGSAGGTGRNSGGSLSGSPTPSAPFTGAPATSGNSSGGPGGGGGNLVLERTPETNPR
jgi:tetratricopeptide (TPR) repeat protein